MPPSGDGGQLGEGPTTPAGICIADIRLRQLSIGGPRKLVYRQAQLLNHQLTKIDCRSVQRLNHLIAGQHRLRIDIGELRRRDIPDVDGIGNIGAHRFEFDNTGLHDRGAEPPIYLTLADKVPARHYHGVKTLQSAKLKAPRQRFPLRRGCLKTELARPLVQLIVRYGAGKLNFGIVRHKSFSD